VGDAKSIKQSIRERVWKALEEGRAVTFPRPVRGRIPNFAGAERACLNAVGNPEFKRAIVVKINPDSPQRFCREQVLRMGKVLIMPTPRLKDGFLLIDPSSIPDRVYSEASTISGAYKWGKFIEPWELPRIDLVIIGSVAVNPRNGRRLGKSHGYAEIEWGILSELNKVGEDTPVFTTVHDMQLVDDEIPREPFDLPVDYVFTPTKSIKIERRDEKPRGILWQYLDEETIRQIPILSKLRRSTR